MKWLYKLEYKHGKHYIRRLMLMVTIGMVVVFVAQNMVTVNFIQYLTLDRAAIMQGQIWRLITFIFVPPSSGNMFGMAISLYFYYMMGTQLENYWGGFRFNFYYLFGILGAIIAMFITGAGTNTFINLSLFLAFATIAPDTSFLLFFILPIKAKWMAVFYVAMLALQLFEAFSASSAIGLIMLVSLAFSLLGYFVFFGRSLIESIRNQMRIAKNRRNWRDNNR